MSGYAGWLRAHDTPVFHAAETDWRTYQGALVPVPDVPRPVELGRQDADRLLRRAGAQLVRYPGRAVPGAGLGDGFYYVVCDRCPDLSELTRKARYELRQGLARCRVEAVPARWLAEAGYDCYRAAHSRYRSAAALDRAGFEREILDRADGPFEFRAAFAGTALAGYASCIAEGGWALHSVAKYHPDYLHERTAYALARALTEEYVGARGLTLVNGTRPVAHDTNYNGLLARLGFRPVHCELRIRYRPLVGAGVALAWRVRGLARRLPSLRLRAALALEGLRRAGATA